MRKQEAVTAEEHSLFSQNGEAGELMEGGENKVRSMNGLQETVETEEDCVVARRKLRFTLIMRFMVRKRKHRENSEFICG